MSLSKQKGSSSLPILLAIAFLMFYFYADYTKRENNLENFRNNVSQVSAEELVRINRYREIATNELKPGLYKGEASKDGVYLEYIFYFMDNGEVIKEFSGNKGSREVEFKGRAKYEIIGSVITYEIDSISGDKGIFFDEGEIIKVIDDNNIAVVSDNIAYYMKRQEI